LLWDSAGFTTQSFQACFQALSGKLLRSNFKIFSYYFTLFSRYCNSEWNDETPESWQFERSYPISELNYKHLNNIRYFLNKTIIFSRFFVNSGCFPQVFFQILVVTRSLWDGLLTLPRIFFILMQSHLTKHFVETDKVELDGRVTLSVKPGLSLTHRLLG